LRIGAAVEEQPDCGGIAFFDRHVKRRVVVDAALIRIRPEREQQLDDLGDIHPRVHAWCDPPADYRRNQRRKPIIHRRIRIRADLQQRANERERTVIDRVHETPQGAIVAPAPPAPEARILIIRAADADALARALENAKGSDLAAAIALARFGILDEADTALARLAAANPNADAVTRLRQQLSDRRFPR